MKINNVRSQDSEIGVMYVVIGLHTEALNPVQCLELHESEIIAHERKHKLEREGYRNITVNRVMIGEKT